MTSMGSRTHRQERAEVKGTHNKDDLEKKASPLRLDEEVRIGCRVK